MAIYKFLQFKPKLIPTLFTIPTLILLFSLSYWQFERLEWKEGLIDAIKQKNQLAEIILPNQVKLPDMVYRQVALSGEFIHDQEMHIYGGSREFKGEEGYYILTPMRLVDGRVIIINRGWVSKKLKNPLTRLATLSKGQVEVHGTIMQNEAKGLYVYDNQPERNLWFYINLAEMKSWLKIDIENFYILAKDQPPSLIRGRNIDPNLRNHHLGYALTWLFSALALLVIYIVYHQEKK